MKIKEIKKGGGIPQEMLGQRRHKEKRGKLLRKANHVANVRGGVAHEPPLATA